jgi:hypothetical protein
MSQFELPAKNLQLGVGVNVITGSGTAPAFKQTPTKENSILEARKHLAEISTSYDYERAIRATAEAEGKGVGGAASASVSYLQRQVSGQTSLTFLDGVTVRTKRELIDDQSNWELNDTARKLLKANPEKLLKDYGTHFVGGIIYGGSYMGTVTIETRSSTPVEELAAALGGTYKGAAEVSGSASFASELKKKEAYYEIKAESAEDGVCARPFTLGDIADMGKYRDEFQAALEESSSGGKALIAICYPWTRIPEIAEILFEKGITIPTPDTAVCDLPARELRRLDYALKTVSHISDADLYIGKSQRELLIDLRLRVQEAQSKIRQLSMDDLTTLDVATAHERYVVSDTIERDLEPISEGVATIHCICTATPPWIWVDDGTPATGPRETRHVLIKERPSAEWRVVRSLLWPGKQTGAFELKYDRVDDEGNHDPNGKRKLMAKIVAHKRYDYHGLWAGKDESSQTGSWTKMLTNPRQGDLHMSARFESEEEEPDII